MAINIHDGLLRHPYLTTQPVIVPPEIGAHQDLPEFIRLPKNGQRCHHTGLSRASINELILGTSAPVKSVYLRKPGTARGIRLVHLPSLLAHLHREMARQLEENSNGGICHE
jgi:hypothetical protein